MTIEQSIENFVTRSLIFNSPKTTADELHEALHSVNVSYEKDKILISYPMLKWDAQIEFK